MSASTGAPVGIPMSSTRTSPACSLPGAIHSPGLAAWKVAVAGPDRSAGHLAGAPSTPLGTSAASTGTRWR